MIKQFLALASLAGALAMPPAARAQNTAPEHPFVHPLFTDNMVLQRDMRDPVWGWATPGSHVTVKIHGASATATAGPDGKWMARLAPLSAGGPYEMVISGPQTVTLKNVLVGDVWICSGQSNMEMGVEMVNNAQQEIAAADYPNIRLYTVPKSVAYEPRDVIDSHWLPCSPANIHQGVWGGFSAAGYFFGRELYKRLNVPIGLIHTSWGGTIAEAWTSAGTLKTLPDFVERTQQVEDLAKSIRSGTNDFDQRMAAWFTKNDPAGDMAWTKTDFDSSSWATMDLPVAWESAGLPNYDGVAWFRLTINVPAEAAGKEAKLHLGPIDDIDTTWVNGTNVGTTAGWDKARVYTVPGSALKAGANVIVVRVLDTSGAGGIDGKPEQLFLETGDGGKISLAGKWSYKATSQGKLPDPPTDTSYNPNVSTVLYNAMINPLVPFGIKGAIWYQGESNAGRAYQYRQLLPAMIGDWRAQWKQGSFPFYIVQLASFNPSPANPAESDWAELREAQLMTSQKVPNSGLAVAIDIGDVNDIHPKNKQEVGRRLALNALGKTYGQQVEYAGPTYTGMKVEGGKIRLSFSHIGGGLEAKGDRLRGFAIAGDDHKFVWADATIDGNTVVVSAPAVPAPKAVRYGWAPSPVCNLYNKAGLPASPFRTDDWPGVTVNNH